MFRARRLFALLMVTILVFGALAQALAAQDDPRPDRRFGAVSAFWLPQKAADLNLGWERILFYWSEIQPSGPDDWNTLHVMDEWLQEAEQQQRQVVGLLKNTPSWATDGVPYGGVPRGLYLPHDDPDNLWAVFVRRVAEYYGPRGVHDWIIWNEPDIDQGVYGSEWAGTVEDYYRLVKVAYLTLQEVDPQATVHLAGLTYWHDVVAGRPQYLERFLRVARADPEAPEHDYFFDVVSLHIYFRSETVGDIVRHVDQIQNNFGLDKPIWINETNAAPTDDPQWPVVRPQFQLDLEQQAWYVVQAHALGFAAGAERIGIYKLFDVGLAQGEESFGLVRADGSIRPAYYAHQTTIRTLQHFTGVSEERDDRSYQVTFQKPRGTTRVLWARTSLSTTVSITATLDGATLVNATGESRPITPTNGVYTVTLRGARCRAECIVGGPPLFLVEQVPEPTPTPSATPTATSTPTPTATPSPTSTPTATTTPTPSVTMTQAPPGGAETPGAAQQESTTVEAARLPAPWWVLGGAGGLALILLGGLLLRRRD